MQRDATETDPVERHFWLTRSVARVAGVNLSQAIACSAFSPDDYAQMVARCAAADCHTACEAWLACPRGAARSVPDHCVHADLLRRLRAQMHGAAGTDANDR